MIDFRPSSAQQLLVSTAREYLRRHCPIEPDRRAGLDVIQLWRGMAELGWPGLLISSGVGGSDGTLVDVILLVEELGYAAVPGPFVPSAVAATSLLLAGGARQQRRLTELATGDRIATVALVEERGSFDPAGLTLTAASGRLTGRKLFVGAADLADDLVVVLRDGVVVLPSDRRGIARVPLQAIGGDPLFEVRFDDVEIGADDRLAVTAGAVAAALEAGALARTAEMVGAARRILEMSVEHAKTRVQGGRPIGGHQAIQHACADLVRDVDTARGLLYAAACDASDVAAAKAYASEACLTVARRAHQIFGAISYCAEHPLHMIHKRILAASLDFGDTTLHLERVARAIGLEA
ncbi:MAG: acyl-CoA dehydrogenase [Candidatus Rokubacteria bacterium]|nr:acyl-CoA dehydrogenase [Candidatus Rokubacteria bacterium]